MEDGYTLAWLDYLVTVSLNPNKVDLNTILPEQIILLESKVEEDKIQHQIFLKKKIFSLLEENKISLLIREYHSALIILLDQALKNYENISDEKPLLEPLANSVINSVEELLSFIEIRFSGYVGLNERVPFTYLSATKKIIKQKAQKLKTDFKKIKDKELAEIIMDHLYSFSDPSNVKCSVLFQEVLYVEELVKELDSLETKVNENDVFTHLDKLLIYLNFNSTVYLNYITKKIASNIKDIETVNDKIDLLQFYCKDFNQLNKKPGIVLYPNQTDLKVFVENWLNQEILYLEKTLKLSQIPLSIKTENSGRNIARVKEKNKVLCELSTDQMAITLRGLDELQILKARSMNEVFKTIVPHLSTPFKEELSYDSVRSKSYAAEERDKMIVIKTLQQLIEKVKRY